MALRFKMERRPGGGINCLVSIGDVTIGAASSTAEQALYAASGLASDLSKAMDAHPELKALLPPQATAALQAIKIASWAAKHGRLPEAAAKIGPVAVKTVKNLLRSIL